MHIIICNNNICIIFLSKIIAITIILNNNVDNAFLLIRIELINYMAFYLTYLFADVPSEKNKG